MKIHGQDYDPLSTREVEKRRAEDPETQRRRTADSLHNEMIPYLGGALRYVGRLQRYYGETVPELAGLEGWIQTAMDDAVALEEALRESVKDPVRVERMRARRSGESVPSGASGEPSSTCP